MCRGQGNVALTAGAATQLHTPRRSAASGLRASSTDRASSSSAISEPHACSSCTTQTHTKTTARERHSRRARVARYTSRKPESLASACVGGRVRCIGMNMQTTSARCRRRRGRDERAYPLVVCDLQVHVVQQDGAEVLVLVGLEALNLRRNRHNAAGVRAMSMDIPPPMRMNHTTHRWGSCCYSRHRMERAWRAPLQAQYGRWCVTVPAVLRPAPAPVGVG